MICFVLFCLERKITFIVFLYLSTLSPHGNRNWEEEEGEKEDEENNIQRTQGGWNETKQQQNKQKQLK